MERISPRILLLTDGAPTADGMGARRTLFNLFSQWPEEKFCTILWNESHREWPDDAPFKKMATHISRRPFYVPPRFRPRCRKYFRRLYAAWFHFQAGRLKKKLRQFKPQLVLVYAESPDIVIFASRLLQDCQWPCVFYLMDDILDPQDITMTSEATRFLQDADGWIVISDPLAECIAKRWKIKKPSYVVAHNPVDTRNILPLPPRARPDSNFQVAYAGSIWQMHLDALELTAAAVEKLCQDNIHIELVIYTSEAMWDYNKHRLERAGCRYGGFRDPSQLAFDLQKANLLLVCSSFSSEMKGFASSSVQTKLTDYMAAGRPILSVGPDYAICHEFVNRWKCGFDHKNDSIEELAEFLRVRMASVETDYIFGQNGRQAVLEHFSIQSVSERVNFFLNQTASDCHRKIKA